MQMFLVIIDIQSVLVGCWKHQWREMQTKQEDWKVADDFYRHLNLHRPLHRGLQATAKITYKTILQDNLVRSTPISVVSTLQW